MHTYLSCFSLLANEIIWRIVRSLIDCLPKPFREARQTYHSETFGRNSPTPRWKTCNALIDKYFRHAATLLYVNKRVREDALKEVSSSFYWNCEAHGGVWKVGNACPSAKEAEIFPLSSFFLLKQIMSHMPVLNFICTVTSSTIFIYTAITTISIVKFSMLEVFLCKTVNYCDSPRLGLYFALKTSKHQRTGRGETYFWQRSEWFFPSL